MIPRAVMLCGKAAEWQWNQAGGTRLRCNRETGHPGTCSATGSPRDDGRVNVTLRVGPA